MVEGAHGDDQPLAVLELAQLYAAYAEDVHTGSTTAPTFEDAVRMHKLINAAVESGETGRHVAPG